jgi:hypothetical protein
LALFWRLIVSHFECPDIFSYFSTSKVLVEAITGVARC